MARTLKATIKKSNIREKLKAANALLARLRHLQLEPQDSLPDIFVWLISNNRRVAYHRIEARDLLFSIVDEEKGKNCGRVQTLFLKVREYFIFLNQILRSTHAYFSLVAGKEDKRHSQLDNPVQSADVFVARFVETPERGAHGTSGWV